MRIKLRSADVSALSDRLMLLIDVVKRRFPLRWNDGRVQKVCLSDIYRFLEKYSIKLVAVNMLGKKCEAVATKIPSKDGKIVKYAIIVNKDIFNLPKDAANRVLKSVLLHEICHILGSHNGAIAYKAGTGDEIRTESFEKYVEQRPGQNLEAELLSSILAFWPNEEFIRQMKNTKANFREMANSYKMPVDCLLKWAVLQFAMDFGVHYFKWNVDKICAEDSYGDKESWIVENPDTAFSKAQRDHCDSSSNNPDFDCICRAYYEDKKFGFNKEADKVLVFGINRVQFGDFCARN